MSEMSNERQETVSDIVSEMRHDCPARHMDGTMYRDVDWVYTKGTVKRLADRIEAAANHQFRDTTKMIPEEVAVSKMGTTTPTCEKSSQVRNTAAMRDALAQAQRVLHCAIVADILKGEDAHEALNAVSTALSAPPRNCDIPLIVDEAADNVADKAWLAFRRCNPNVYFDVSGLLGCIKWLFDEAKGETK